MTLDYLVFPFIFIAMYFEVFLLITFLSRPSKKLAQVHTLPENYPWPFVAMIVPCYNEQSTIDGTVKSLLALDYPKDKLQIILVNDGSTDNTKVVMDAYQGNEQITIIHKENGGKHTGLNAGIELATQAEFVGCLDADSFVDSTAMKEVVLPFKNDRVAAVTSAMSVFEPKNFLEHTQNAEYVLGIALRYILSIVNGLHVTPGPLSLYRKSIFATLGGFRKGHNTEDMEMALRIQKAGYIIENAPLARVYTKVPTTPRALVKQRTRWTTGFLRNVLFDYRDLVGNYKYGALGLFVLPLGFVSLVGALIVIGVFAYNLFVSIARFITQMWGLPWSYILTPNFSFDWFYLPITAVLLFGILSGLGAIALIVLGKHISKTRQNITLGVVGYLCIYGLIAPFWLIKSFMDLFAGVNRSWR
jgi:biofilm PGA synthesis N-glycosyltransferase PgaC